MPAAPKREQRSDEIAAKLANIIVKRPVELRHRCILRLRTELRFGLIEQTSQRCGQGGVVHGERKKRLVQHHLICRRRRDCRLTAIFTQIPH